MIEDVTKDISVVKGKIHCKGKRLKPLTAVEMDSLLEDYSKFLEESGYLDDDWWCEKPTAIERFKAERKRLGRRRCENGKVVQSY